LLIISDEVKKIYPEAFMGILVMKNVCNPKKHMEPLKTYNNYYKKFKKTYHVLLQLESIVFKNKSIHKVASLVEVMFIAELKNLLLTAGHDLMFQMVEKNTPC
jgi:hypothetical protein